MDEYQEIAKLKCENDELKHRCSQYEKIVDCFMKRSYLKGKSLNI